MAAGTADKEAVLLEDFAYVELNDLEVTNQKGAPGDYAASRWWGVTPGR